VEVGATDVRQGASRATLSGAHDAFFAGDFEGCLSLCDGIVVRDEPMQLELALLRARTLLRLDRADKAIDALNASAFTPTSVDGIVTAGMLLGASYVRLGQHERGEALLDEAHKRSEHAHPTIRAELTVHRGVARYVMGRHDEADALLASVPENADIIRARALEYRGWIYFVRGRFDLAMSFFRAAFDCIGTCRWHDRFIEANVLHGLATLCAEMADTEDWHDIEESIRTFDWSAEGLGRPRFWVAMYSSMMCELLGDEDGARAWARSGQERAPNRGYEALALCRMAEVFRGLCEKSAHVEFALRARNVYATLDVRELGTDQKQLPLFIAEELAHAGVIDEARRLMTQYREVIAPTVRAVAGDDRFAAAESEVDACLAEALGQRNAAVQLYTHALGKFRKAQYRRRASAVALRLARLTGAARYRRFASAVLRGADSRYWVARELATLHDDSRPSLTDGQRAILSLVAKGKTYKEIGATMGRSWKTVSNSVEQLRGKFGVGTRGELVAEAMRLGIVHVSDRTGASSRTA
jgi:DNA-binding CsgD family transcriptional regulator